MNDLKYTLPERTAKIMDVIPAYIIAVLFACWPFLVIAKKITVSSPHMNLINSGVYINFFAYYRLLFIGIAMTILLFLLIIRLYRGKSTIRFIPVYRILGIVVFYLMAAVILSPYREALVGASDRSRGGIAYGILFAYAFLISAVMPDKRRDTIIISGFYISTILISVISIFQYFALDPYVHFPLKLISGVSADMLVSKREFVTSGGLYNKLGLGGYQAVALAVFTIVYFKTKSVKKSVMLFISLLIIGMSLISSAARGGWFGYIVFFVLYVIVTPGRSYKKISALILGYLVVFSCMNIYSGYTLPGQLRDPLYLAIALIVFILIGSGVFTRIMKKTDMRIYFFSLFIIIVFSLLILAYFSPYKENATLMKAGSGRGYIFWKTAGVIMKHPVFGIGPETLLYHLDLEDPYRYRYLTMEILDKPHSFYLGLALDGGLPFMLFFLFLISLILQALWKKRTETASRIIFWALVVYLVQGLTFGPLISTDIILFTLLGLGMNTAVRETR